MNTHKNGGRTLRYPNHIEGTTAQNITAWVEPSTLDWMVRRCNERNFSLNDTASQVLEEAARATPQPDPVRDELVRALEKARAHLNGDAASGWSETMDVIRVALSRAGENK